METLLQISALIAIPCMAVASIIHYLKIRHGRLIMLVCFVIYVVVGILIPLWFSYNDDGKGGMALLGVVLIFTITLPFLQLVLAFSYGLYRFKTERRNGLHLEMNRAVERIRKVTSLLGTLAGIFLGIMFLL